MRKHDLCTLFREARAADPSHGLSNADVSAVTMVVAIPCIGLNNGLSNMTQHCP